MVSFERADRSVPLTSVRSRGSMICIVSGAALLLVSGLEAPSVGGACADMALILGKALDAVRSKQSDDGRSMGICRSFNKGVQAHCNLIAALLSSEIGSRIRRP